MEHLEKNMFMDNTRLELKGIYKNFGNVVALKKGGVHHFWDFQGCTPGAAGARPAPKALAAFGAEGAKIMSQRVSNDATTSSEH